LSISKPDGMSGKDFNERAGMAAYIGAERVAEAVVTCYEVGRKLRGGRRSDCCTKWYTRG
jgi:hypothetical protein